MLRAATWAMGLFGLAMVICRAFPVPWLEPIALLAAGVAMLWASSVRPRLRPRRTRAQQPKEAAA